MVVTKICTIFALAMMIQRIITKRKNKFINLKNFIIMATSINSILATISVINNGTMGTIVEMTTTPNWVSVSAKKNPYLHRVVKHTRITNIGLGICYKNVVESHAERSGVDTDTTPYIPSEPKGMHYPTDSEGNIVTRKYLISNSNPNQYYLNVVYRGNENLSSTFYLDGVEVTDSAVLADIKAHIKVSAPSTKQTNYGVAEEDIVIVNRPKFENIVCIKQGDKIYSRGYIIEKLAQ